MTVFLERQNQYQVKEGRPFHLQGQLLSWASMPVPPPPRRRWWAKTAPCLYSFYHNNNGSPLATTIACHSGDLRRLLPEDAHIVYSCSTGYGEALIKAALMLDEGEVETVSHYYAAAFFDTGCRLHSGHRRPGHEMHQNQKSDGRQCSVKRSLFLRLRFFH